MLMIRSTVSSGAKWLVAAFAVLTLAACSTTYPPAPAAAASADYNYIIGPGDESKYRRLAQPGAIHECSRAA